jgi:hypothetical protein
VGGYGVFLDLKQDKYTAISPDDLRTLRATVEGWPTTSTNEPQPVKPASASASTGFDSQTSSAPHAPEDDVIETLVKEGLITADASHGKLATPAHIEAPAISLWDFPRPWPQLSARDLRRFVSAWAATTMRLRALPIRHVVNRLRKGEIHRRRQSSSFDINKARFLTTIFFALQPVFYSAKDACLRNSLTLLEFLAKYELYPTCVFGVKMEPFAAHAWVQQGAVVLTDPIEHVKTFTPIMLV